MSRVERSDFFKGRKIKGVRAIVAAAALFGAGLPFIGQRAPEVNAQPVAPPIPNLNLNLPDIPVIENNPNLPEVLPIVDRLGRNNLVVNPSFEIPARSTEGRRRVIDPSRPAGWVTADPANSHYNFREGGAHQGRSFVSADVIEFEDPIFGDCGTAGGGWRTEKTVAINPENSYNLAFWAKQDLNLEGTVAIPGATVEVFDAQGNGLTSFTTFGSFTVAENVWEPISFSIGGAADNFQWPSGADTVRIGLLAIGFTANPACEPGKIASVGFDDVSFRP